jgi:hypothetical protein
MCILRSSRYFNLLFNIYNLVQFRLFAYLKEWTVLVVVIPLEVELLLLLFAVIKVAVEKDLGGHAVLDQRGYGQLSDLDGQRG